MVLHTSNFFEIVFSNPILAAGASRTFVSFFSANSATECQFVRSYTWHSQCARTAIVSTDYVHSVNGA